MNILQLIGLGIGLALAVAVWPLAMALAVSLWLLAGLNSRAASRPPTPPAPPPAEPLLGDLRRQELAKVAERNREHLEVCFLMSERDR